MSATVRPGPLDGSPGHHDPDARSERATAKARALGLTSATGLVTGSIIGTGGRGGPRCMTCLIERDPA